MIKTLITPSEVLEIAFDDRLRVPADSINPAQILAAEAQYIQPIFGDIYTAMQQDQLVDFVNDYIKPALAVYVKVLQLPLLGVVQGTLGLSYAATHKDLELTDDKIEMIRAQLLSDANALLKRAVRYVKDNEHEFSQYEDAKTLSATFLAGGIILNTPKQWKTS